MSKRHYDWRKGRKIHEAADRFPMMGPQQLDELAADIKANGLTLPPVYFVTKAGERLLVDGRNRLEACCRAGINPDVEGNEIHEGKVDPYSYVISANIRRRHLSNTQKRHLIAWLIAKQPQKSDRAIAKDVDASHHTVASVRRSNGQNAHKSADRRETSGKLTRGRKPGASAPKKKPNASPPIRPSETAPTTTATTSPAEQATISGEGQALDLALSNMNTIDGTPSGAAAASAPGAMVMASSSPQQSNDTAASAEPGTAAAAPSRLEQWKQLTRDLTPEEFTAAKAWFQQYTGSSGGALSEFTEPRAA